MTVAAPFVDVTNEYKLINYDWLRVTAGDLNLRYPTVNRIIRGISNVFIHPRFNPISLENNIAVIRVDQPFPLPHLTAELAERSTRILRDNIGCRVPVWGYNVLPQTALTFNNALTYVNANSFNRDACNNILLSHVNPHVITESTICTNTQNFGLACRVSTFELASL